MSEFRFMNHTPQEELPDEQWMKHFIEHYRWLLIQNDKLSKYAKHLENEYEQLKKKCIYHAEKNIEISRKFTEKNRECKRLRAHIKWLNSETNKIEEDNDDRTDSDINIRLDDLNFDS